MVGGPGTWLCSGSDFCLAHNDRAMLAAKATATITRPLNRSRRRSASPSPKGANDARAEAPLEPGGGGDDEAGGSGGEGGSSKRALHTPDGHFAGNIFFRCRSARNALSGPPSSF